MILISLKDIAGRANMPMPTIFNPQRSAALIGFVDMPPEVATAALAVTNADGVTDSRSVTQEGCVWKVLLPGTHFETAGKVVDGVTLKGYSEDGDEFIIGIGDLVVRSASATPEPGETVTNITDKTLEGETFDLDTADGENAAVRKLITKLGGSVALLLLSFTALAAPPSGYTNNTYTADGVTWTRHGSLNVRTSYVVTDTQGGVTSNAVAEMIGGFAATGTVEAARYAIKNGDYYDVVTAADNAYYLARTKTSTNDVCAIVTNAPWNCSQPLYILPYSEGGWIPCTTRDPETAQGAPKGNADSVYLVWEVGEWSGNVPLTATRQNALGLARLADISTNNPAFVAAVTNCPVQIAAADAIDLGEFGSFGTIGAALAALAAAVAALKRGKVTTISAASTDAQYPSAKCVYDIVGDVEAALAQINGTAANSGGGQS